MVSRHSCPRRPKANIAILILLFFVSVHTVVGANFDQCLQNIHQGNFGEVGGCDNHGQPVPIANATAITYELCVRACGSGPEPFQWSVFSQEFSSWLLPWLALVSQLPFGSEDKLDNLISMLLTVGSPTLAAYSLALTVLNGRWIARRFSSYTFPNTQKAVRILSSLQQSPLHVTDVNSLLASLIVLRENDEWWSELVIWLNYTHTWSISAVSSIAWVIIAYLFTVIDSFTGDITISVNGNGESVGSLWIWLLPIVIGWLQISPKCDSARLFQAMGRANNLAYVAMPTGNPIHASSLSRERAITLRQGVEDSLHHDENCTVPIYNYARFLPWVQAVEVVSDMFRAASKRAHRHIPVNGDRTWEGEESYVAGVHKSNRIGTRDQVRDYCLPCDMESPSYHRRTWKTDVVLRVIVASLMALLLQWGTTAAALVVVWFTPTTGLGCRSGAYILYGSVSTTAWILLLISSFLAYYVSTAPKKCRKTILARTASITIRRLGKTLAVFNAVWIMVTCLFQFSNFFDRCFCNSSVLGRGLLAWDVIIIIPDDVPSMKDAWIGGVVLAAGSATVFGVFVYLLVDPQLPE